MAQASGTRAPRVKPSRTVFVEYKNHLARVRNISVTGAYIEDTRPLMVGGMVHFKLWLDDRRPVETAALVRRREPAQGIGVQFLRLNKLDQERLKAALSGPRPS
ncbi:MAG: PilZ domain-containing protein [Terriglobia bacterium]